MTKYAPILIATLDRYDLFMRCLESLSANPWAKYTPVYVALDYPFKEEHWDGYNKIREFLKGNFNFKELNIIERTTNFGPADNYADAIEQVFLKYDRIILSEDDNEFSPNFLEYIDKGLEKFENDSNILAICGYMWPNMRLLHNENNFIKQRIAYSGWGGGIWKNRYQELKSTYFKKYAKENLRFPGALCLFLKKPKIFDMSMRVFRNDDEDVMYDISISLFMFKKNKFLVQPIISKVRNIGFDGSGITSGVNDSKYFSKQEIDSSSSFFFTGEDKNIRQNEKILSKVGIGYFPGGHLGKKHYFKILIKYIILKIFGVDLLNKWSNPFCWGPKTFAKMRSAYLAQKAQKEEKNA